MQDLVIHTIDFNQAHTQNTFAHLNLLLKTFHHHPELIKEIIRDKEKNHNITNQLTSETQKIEKFDHKNFFISYLIEMKDKNQIYEYRLNQPIKKHKKIFKEQDGDTYLVMNEFLGKGSCGTVKGSTINYWYDGNGRLQRDETHPIARKTIKKTSDRMYFETHAAIKYYGCDHAAFYKRIKHNKKDIYEISMPKFPTTLDKLIENHNIEQLSFSDRCLILLNIAKEISIFHKKTKMVHHDIKPENIAIDDRFNITLLDFEFANVIGKPVVQRGTYGYRDANLIYETRHSNQLNDFYALGFIIYQMFYPRITKSDSFLNKIVAAGFTELNRSLLKGNEEVPDEYNALLLSIVNNVTAEKEYRVSGEPLIHRIEKLYQLAKSNEESKKIIAFTT